MSYPADALSRIHSSSFAAIIILRLMLASFILNNSNRSTKKKKDFICVIVNIQNKPSILIYLKSTKGGKGREESLVRKKI